MHKCRHVRRSYLAPREHSAVGGPELSLQHLTQRVTRHASTISIGSGIFSPPPPTPPRHRPVHPLPDAELPRRLRRRSSDVQRGDPLPPAPMCSRRSRMITSWIRGAVHGRRIRMQCALGAGCGLIRIIDVADGVTLAARRARLVRRQAALGSGADVRRDRHITLDKTPYDLMVPVSSPLLPGSRSLL